MAARSDEVIIVLGGTCFQGRKLIERLLHHSPGYSVIVVNRGNVYWDASTPPEWSGARGSVRHVKADRDEKGFGVTVETEVTALCGSLAQVVGVVDFSCFHPRHIYEILPFLLRLQEEHQRRFLYVFISSDSVYDVCEYEQFKEADGVTSHHNGLISEELTQLSRPHDPRTRLTLHKQNRYGGNKLKIEDVLRQTQLAFQWVALRLADVIGPFEDTGRFWATYLIAKYGENRVLKADVASSRVVLTFSEDVVNLILRCFMENRSTCPTPQTARSTAPPHPPTTLPSWDSESSSSADSDSSSSSSSSCSSTSTTASNLQRLAARVPFFQEGPQHCGEAGPFRRAYNVCCPEVVTMKEFAEVVLQFCGGGGVTVVGRGLVADRRDGTIDFFPSVDCGPMHCGRAEGVLGFVGTPLKTALEATVRFFDMATQNAFRGGFAGEWKRAQGKLPKNTKIAVEREQKRQEQNG